MSISIREIDPDDVAAVKALLAGSSPGVMRGLVSHWPVVAAARQGDGAALAYLGRTIADRPVEVSIAPASATGRFHYAEDFRGFTFERSNMPPTQLLAALAIESSAANPRAIAAQGLLARTAAPAFLAENPPPLQPDAGDARLWLGNRAQVATHSDPADNLAYCAIGRRRFTLFPPEQLTNLYLGPFDPTPGGTPIAMTDPLAPDFERYPRFAAALEAAQIAELEPGDGLFIPYGWYHHVEALSPLAMLVNTWWPEPGAGIGTPWDVLLHAFMSLRPMGPKARRHWAAMLLHYGLEADGHAGSHLPEHAQGVLGARSTRDLEAMRAALLRTLSQQPGPDRQ